ncbi:ADP-ribosylation factor-like protein 13B [Chelonus insularis]|uniref:ADP-ribosylation factor-like protein 13B n=1 Tax=Chelonus insularis TaxID=460826 RepID=UPI00158848D0|nr:ADP-ribosylation factor-like protein 13B [Chelonus insularis]
MGNCLRSIYNIYSRKRLIRKNIVLLMTGLDNAGKTSVLNCISHDFDEGVISTMGFRVVQLKHKCHSIKVYDVGGAKQIRAIWKKYFNDIHGLIYVVDASDISRLNENRIVFGELTSHEHIAGKPILLLANKQDVIGAIDELDLVENLDVEKAVNSMRCPTRVETCACVFNEKNFKPNTQGITDGYKWLLDTIIKNYATLDERINTSQPTISVVNNHSCSRSKRPSISSIALSHISTHSNPFKPINELVMISGKNSAVKNNHVEDRRESSVKSFLVRNKTAPMSDNMMIPRSDSIEYFNENESNDEVAFVTLDPLNLISKRMKDQSRAVRPFTAPVLSRNVNTFIIPNIPGQVPL